MCNSPFPSQLIFNFLQTLLYSMTTYATVSLTIGGPSLYLVETSYIPYFFNQTPRLIFISLLVSVWLLFEGAIYFFGKSADINDGWIRYARAIRLLDAVSSTHSLPVLLSETSRTTQAAQMVAG